MCLARAADEAIELGPEWFLLGPKASAMRAELAATTGQSSLPHCFVNGKSVGGLYSGNDIGEGLACPLVRYGWPRVRLLPRALHICS